MTLHDSTNRRSRRQNLAQGEASAASETLGNRSLKIRARFSGRQIIASLVVLMIFLIAASCKRNEGGITATPGGWPPSSSKPAEVSSSAQVVKVTTSPVQIEWGGAAEAVVRLSISTGYHVNANPATYPYLIATEVQFVPDPNGFCIKVDKPIYPAPKTQKFAFAESPLAVYEGDIEVKLPLHLPKMGPGCRVGPMPGIDDKLSLNVRVQACDNEKCFPPATVKTEIVVKVK